jgi:NAD(P)H-flavin reductase
MEYQAAIEVDDREIQNYVANEFSPDDIFPKEELETWAEENGFVKESDIDYDAWAEKNGYVKQ